MVRQESAKLLYASSILAQASKIYARVAELADAAALRAVETQHLVGVRPSPRAHENPDPHLGHLLVSDGRFAPCLPIRGFHYPRLTRFF